MSEERTVIIKNGKAVLPELPPGTWKISCPELMEDVTVDTEKVVTFQIPSLFTISKEGIVTSLSSNGQSLFDKGELSEIRIPPYINGIRCISMNDTLLNTLSSLSTIKVPYIFHKTESVVNNDLVKYYLPKEEIDKTDLTFYLKDDNTYGVGTKSNIPAYSGISSLVVIPDFIDDIPITEIGDFAFKNCRSINKIKLPNSINSIGAYAFAQCLRLSSFNTPLNVMEIKEGAFYNCQQMNSISLNILLESIGNKAFENCRSLTSIDIPDSVTSIGNDAFRTSGLNSVQLGSGLTFIGECAFRNTSLTNINIPSGVNIIKKSTFEWCTQLSDVIINNVSIIEDEVFANCTALTSISLPDTVTSIGEYTFGGCYNLTKIITSEAEGFPWGAINATIINLAVPGLYKEDNSFISWDTLISNGDIIIRNECHARYNRENCSNLVGSLVFPSDGSITEIGDFSEAQLSFIYIPDSIVSIMVNAFYYNHALTSITIPDSITSIGYGTFMNCTALTSITIPDSVTSIGFGAFTYTPWLANKQSENPLVIVNNILIDGTTCTGDITIPNNVISIGGAFWRCDTVTSITIPDSVTRIEPYSFAECSSLTSITIGNSVTSIGNDAFEDCTALTSITIPDSVTSIGNSAFFSCTSLTSITIGNSVTSIREMAFRGCTALTSIDIPDSVTSIGDAAFENCTSLTSVIIPDSVTSIGDMAFENCTVLANVYYKGTEEQWNSITIGFGNTPLTSATITYNYTE